MSGLFQSEKRKRSNYMQVTILHGFSTYCSLSPKSVNYADHSKLFRDGGWIGKCLQHMENQCETSVSVRSTHHHMLRCQRKHVLWFFMRTFSSLWYQCTNNFFSRERVCYSSSQSPSSLFAEPFSPARKASRSSVFLLRDFLFLLSFSSAVTPASSLSFFLCLCFFLLLLSSS